MMRSKLFLVLLVSLVASACTTEVNTYVRIVRRATGMAVTCTDAYGVPSPVADCAGADRNIRVWIADGDAGALSILDMDTHRHVDTDKFEPGWTPLAVGDDPIAVRAAPDSTAVYVLLRGGKAIVRVDASSLALTSQSLPCEAESFAVAAKGPAAGSLLVPCAATAVVLQVPVDAFGTHDPSGLATVPVEGAPRYITLSPDASVAYLTHLDRIETDPLYSGRVRWISRVDLATGATTRASLVAACSNGLDDDGDGLVDEKDPGCSGPDDRVEDPDVDPICGNGVDDDLDGATDEADADCPLSEFPLAPLPACANGLDDDGDGRVDLADPGCYGASSDDELDPPARFAGAPSVTPDGRFLYVPRAAPHGISVFATDPFEAVDPNALDGPWPNVLFAHLGFEDIGLGNPAHEVAFVSTADGVRAYVGLGSGQVVRLVVDDAGTVMHRLEASSAAVLRSAATYPTIRVNGVEIDRSESVHPEYPSLGSSLISLVSGTTSSYSYYGIVFGEDVSVQLSETWRVTYEGVVPGAEGRYGFFLDADGLFEDPAADFCAAGVMPGDSLVLSPAADAAMCEGVDPATEYAVVEVGMDWIRVAAPDGKPLPAPACMSGPHAWSVRLNDAWTVVGSRSGFLHEQIWKDGACTAKADANPGFSARALSSVVKGETVAACPPLFGQEDVDWRPFTNIAFSFSIFPACRTLDDFTSQELPVARGTELTFQVSGGQSPKVVSTGGYPMGFVPVGEDLYLFDAAGSVLHVLDTSSMTVAGSYY